MIPKTEKVRLQREQVLAEVARRNRESAPHVYKVKWDTYLHRYIAHIVK